LSVELGEVPVVIQVIFDVDQSRPAFPISLQSNRYSQVVTEWLYVVIEWPQGLVADALTTQRPPALVQGEFLYLHAQEARRKMNDFAVAHYSNFAQIG